MSKPVMVNQSMAYRVHTAKYSQDTYGSCLICRQPFKTCPHSFGQVSEVILHVRAGIALGILTTQKPTRGDTSA